MMSADGLRLHTHTVVARYSWNLLFFAEVLLSLVKSNKAIDE
jgi:hypothetical protein